MLYRFRFPVEVTVEVVADDQDQARQHLRQDLRRLPGDVALPGAVHSRRLHVPWAEFVLPAPTVVAWIDCSCCYGEGHEGSCCPGYLTRDDTGEIERCDACDVHATDDDARLAAEEDAR